MCFPNEKTFREGFEEYILDCKARNLRDGTINHYQESIKQIYKRITPDTLISSMCQQTILFMVDSNIRLHSVSFLYWLLDF